MTDHNLKNRKPCPNETKNDPFVITARNLDAFLIFLKKKENACVFRMSCLTLSHLLPGAQRYCLSFCFNLSKNRRIAFVPPWAAVIFPLPCLLWAVSCYVRFFFSIEIKAQRFPCSQWPDETPGTFGPPHFFFNRFSPRNTGARRRFGIRQSIPILICACVPPPPIANNRRKK